MRLTTTQIETISTLILTRLKEKDLIIFKDEEETVYKRVIRAITEDLRAEDQLDREVESILESHSGSLEDDGIDYRKMFSMIKGKLVRERELII
ncbi:MAG: DUF507 family protein [Thermodesulfobacteriota bacterium]